MAKIEKKHENALKRKIGDLQILMKTLQQEITESKGKKLVDNLVKEASTPIQFSPDK